MTKTATSYDAEHYVQRLDLGDDPFAADFHSDYFYTGAMRRQLLDQLVHFSRFSDQTVVLVGATGSGTSTLLDQASAQIEEVMDSCFINAEELMLPDQLLSSLNEQLHFQLPSPINASEFIATLQASSIIDGEPEPILIEVDQAHYLSLESFELLRDMTAIDSNIVRLLMIGEYQIEHLVRLAAFDQEQIKLLELEPLTVTETSDYLLGLLQSVGYAGELPLSHDQLSVLHEQSGGNLAEINLLMPALLAAKESQAHSRFQMGIPVAHVAAIAIIGVALLLSWLYQGGDSDDVSPRITTITQQEATEFMPSLERLAEQAQGGIVRTESSPRAVAKPLSLTTGTESTLKREMTAEVDKGLPVSKVEPPSESVSSDIEVAVTEIEPEAKGTESAKVLAVPVENKPQSIVLVSQVDAPPLAAPKVVKKAAIEQKKAARLETTAVSPPVSSVAVSVAASVPASKPKIAAIPAREQRLLSYSDSAYVLQLMGSVDEARARRFVKQYVGRLPVTYFETRLKGKPWFVAITGPYDDKATALSVVKVLPAALQKQRPWARSIAGIQKDIRANRQ